MTFAWSTVGTVHINGVRLGLREAGDPVAPPALLLHGSGSNARTWDRFAARLTAAGRRAIAVDLRGHGTSARPGHYALTALRDDVLALVDHLALHDAVLIGHSVGAHAALAAAQQAPETVGRLVLEDLAAPPRLRSPMNGFRPLRVLAAAAGVCTARRDYELRAVGSIVRQLARPDAGWWARLAEVRQPTLFFSGGPTSCIPPGRLAEVSDAIPGARLRTIPVGHRVHSLAPDRFAAEVLGFLSQPVAVPV